MRCNRKHSRKQIKPTQTCNDTICVKEITGMQSLDLKDIQINNLYTTASKKSVTTLPPYRSNILASLSVRKRNGD